MDGKYTIIINEIDDQLNRDVITKRLSQTFKMDEELSSKLISKLPRVAQKNLSRTMAENYVRALEKCGVRAHILKQPAENQSNAVEAFPPQKQATTDSAGRHEIPDMDTFQRVYISYFKSQQSQVIAQSKLNKAYLKEKSVTKPGCAVSALLLTSTPIVVFFLFPRLGFSPNFLLKLLLTLVSACISFFISFTIDASVKKAHHQKLDQAAFDYIRNIFSHYQNKEFTAAALNAWIMRYQQDPFCRSVLKHLRTSITNHALRKDVLAQYEDHLKRLYQHADAQENERKQQKQAVMSVKMKDIHQRRKELLRTAFHPEFSYSEHKSLEAEFAQLLPGMSPFITIRKRDASDADCQPIAGDLYLAFSAKNMIIVQSDSRPPRNLFDVLMGHFDPMFILPPAFVTRLELARGIFSPGNLICELSAPLNSIPMFRYTKGVNPKNYKQILIKSWTEPLRRLFLTLDESQWETLNTGMKTFLAELDVSPNCPICQHQTRKEKPEKSADKNAPVNYFCNSCKTRYVWGVDYLRRITLFPTPENCKSIEPIQLI